MLSIEMSAKLTYAFLLPDDELKAHLERKDTLIFEGLGREWQQIERQVERLGYGDRFIVSQTRSKKIRAKVAPV